MSIFLQIALGMAPAALLFLVLSIVQKKHRPRNIALLSVFVLLLAGSVAGNFIYKSENEAAISNDDASVYLKLIYAVAEEDTDTGLAQELLRDLRSNAVSSLEILECDALLRAKNGDYIATKALINKAEQIYNIEYSAKLKELCDACIKESKIDYATSAYYNEDSPAESGNAVENLKKFADNKLKEKLEDEDDSIEDAAEVLIESERTFSDYLNSNVLDSETVSKLTKRIKNACDDNSSLLSVSLVRLCRLKLMVLNGNYSEIAELIDESSSYEELAIASELYISRLIRESHFNDDFADGLVKMYEAVSKQVKKAIKAIPEENATEIRRANELLESLEDASDAPALYRVRDKLAEYAADEDFNDRPKAFMQLARVEHALGKSSKAQDCITQALGSIGMCEDDNFTVPMSGIVDTITDKDDPEKLKNVAQYVEDVTANTADSLVSKAVKDAQVTDSYYDDDYPANGSDSVVTNKDFGSFVTDYVSQKRVSFNITNIDASGFETVRATISVDDTVSLTAEELKQIITLEDCGVKITDFQVEKIEYKRANILLCCDVSGSMGGTPIADLRNAVALFADTASDIEHLALITFESYVDGVWDFGTSNSVISAEASSLSAGGGTNMYDALIESIGKFSKRNGEVNFILLLSDGDDGHKRTSEEIMENIGIPARNKGIVLYSLGLGSSVNTDYMHTLATSTGGSFLYINDSTSLNSFYDYLRGQILNQYVITFKAEDTLSVDRELEIRLKEDPLSGDIGYYNLRGDGEDSEYAPSELIGLKDKGVYGLDTRLIYRSSKPVSVKLSGFGFESTDTFSIALDGDLDYDSNSVTVAFEDENTLGLLIPGGIACGTYDVRVTVNGKTAILTDELNVVAQGQEKTTKFGPYVFTSYQKVEGDNTVTLSGYVTMNGWLNFDGSVTLNGDLEGYSITMSEYDGSYVKYYTDTSTGLAAFMAKRNSSLSIPAFGSLKLYNDAFEDPESESYPVEAKPTPMFTLGNMLSLNAAGIELYPNRFEIRSDAFTTKFPLQETLIKAGELDKFFTFDLTADAVVTNKTIGFRLDVNKKGESDVYNPVNLGSMPIYLTPASYKIHIDTVANEYSVDFSTKVAFIDAEGLGFSIEWKERSSDSGLEKLWPSKVMIKADVQINSAIGTVPVTYRDFKLGLDDIDPNKTIWDWMFEGSLDVESVKLSSYIPGLKKYFDDPAVIKLDDATLRFSIGQRYISIETKLQLLEAVDLAEAKIEAGRIPFTNVMLGINNEEVKGLRAALKVGVVWKSDNCDIDLSGAAEFSAHSRFMGVEVIGTCDLEVHWWIFEKAKHAEGRAILGMYTDHNNVHNFIIKTRSQSDSGRGKEYYIYWNNKDGFECGTKKY